MITSQEKLEKLIQEWGFLPFFINRIKGFSIEEHTPQELWFTDEHMAGPWEWKGPVIGNWQSAYGKFYEKKAGWISLEWLPDFMNWRRHLYPLDNLPAPCRHILDTLRECESAISRELKKKCGYSLTRKKKTFNPDNPLTPVINKNTGADFDKLINDLQMGTWVCIADFEYLYSKTGERYGWGLARYCTPEAMYEINIPEATGHRSPEESRNRIICHIKELFPDAAEKEIMKLI